MPSSFFQMSNQKCISQAPENVWIFQLGIWHQFQVIQLGITAGSETLRPCRPRGTLNDISCTGHTPLAHTILVWITEANRYINMPQYCDWEGFFWAHLAKHENCYFWRHLLQLYKSKSSYMWAPSNWQLGETGSHWMRESPMISSRHQDDVRVKLEHEWEPKSTYSTNNYSISMYMDVSGSLKGKPRCPA